MNEELKIKFWGVRGSYPTPGAGTIKYGGNTSCVEITAGERTIILDAGTGIIPLGRELARRAAVEKRGIELLLLSSAICTTIIRRAFHFLCLLICRIRVCIFMVPMAHMNR